MKVIRYFPDGPSAQLAKSILATHEIEAFVGETEDSFAVRGVRLMVPDQDAERAREILKDPAHDLALPDDWEPPTTQDDSGSPAARGED